MPSVSHINALAGTRPSADVHALSPPVAENAIHAPFPTVLHRQRHCGPAAQVVPMQIARQTGAEVMNQPTKGSKFRNGP
jgi:hypothetical protein